MLKPLIHLLVAGSLLGTSTVLAKLAGDVGLPSLAFLAWSLLGATLMLGTASVARGDTPGISSRTLEYFVIAAFVTVAGSNLIFFSAVPVVGASFVALAITLPPLLTYAGTLAFRLERFDLIRLAGVVLALVGAGLLAANKLRAPDAPVIWIALTLLGPVLLAIGNLYRSLRWPEGETAQALAPGMLLAATIMLFLVGMLPRFTLIPVDLNTAGGALILCQAVVFAAQFHVLFLLQKSGGPVFLSLLGSVRAIVTVPIAIVALGEEVPDGLVPACVLIGAGIL